MVIYFISIMSDYPFINDLKDFEQKAYDTGNKIQIRLNNPRRDARVSTLFFVAQVIRFTKIYLILKSEYLDHRDWYIDIYLAKYEQQLAGHRWNCRGNSK
jgi:hypothetical protein